LHSKLLQTTNILIILKQTICIILATAISVCISWAQNVKLTSVVIDPGHGGKDVGAVSKDKKTYEKNLVLDISKRLSEKIKEGCPDVTVTMTRLTDCFVELADRAAIANRINADLFISVHINSSVKTSPNGYSMHILGQSSNPDRDLFEYNMDVCKRENSVIMLEDDTTKYEDFDPDDPESLIFLTLMQSAALEQSMKCAQIISSKLQDGPICADRGIWQNPFFVLWKTSMPSVLVELGFISNSEDLAVLNKEENREKIAEKLYLAFLEYKSHYDSSIK